MYAEYYAEVADPNAIPTPLEEEDDEVIEDVDDVDDVDEDEEDGKDAD